jgi:hypothetical protein
MTGEPPQNLCTFWSPVPQTVVMSKNGYYPLVVIFCLVYGAVLPLFIVFKLYTHRKKLDDVKFRSKYGALFRSFHRVSFFWEVISMLKKASFVVVTQMPSIQSYGSKFLYSIGIIGIISALEIVVQPYAKKSTNFKSTS